MTTAGTAATFAALLLGDGRFPSGAHAHSLGVEAAVQAGLVTDLGDLGAWVEGHLHTTWSTDTAATVLAHRWATRPTAPEAWDRLDAEVTARTTSAQLRAASRQLGRQLLRAAARTWPSATCAMLTDRHAGGPHVAVVQGVAGAAAGLDATTAAVVALHGSLQVAVSAGVRLLGLDPYAVVAAVGDLAPRAAAVVDDAVAAVSDDPAGLPALGAPMTDLLLAAHATADGRLFTS